MGFGMVATRSGFDSDHLGNHQRSLCKKWMKDIAEFIRDLTVLFWWVLPVNAVNMRLYCLIFARIVRSLMNSVMAFIHFLHRDLWWLP